MCSDQNDTRARNAHCHPGGDSNETESGVVILGIGNVLWADEGFGVRCVEQLQREHDFFPAVELIDGGTQGLYLIQHVQAARRLLIFDAVDYGLAPGTLKIVRDSEVPSYMGAKQMSLHQTGFSEVLALAQLTGRFPESITLIGCQPEVLDDFGGSLRDVVRAAMPAALSAAREELAAWGIALTPRAQPLSEDEAVTLPHLSMARYEAERPSADDACREGDPRFLPRAAASRSDDEAH